MRTAKMSDADARGRAYGIALDMERSCDAFHDLARQLAGARRVGGGALQDGELITAEACRDFAATQDLPQPAGNLAQQLIANGMAERIVNVLEVIEVEAENAKRCRSLLRRGACLGQPFEE